jgi:hypothetical protein
MLHVSAIGEFKNESSTPLNNSTRSLLFIRLAKAEEAAHAQCV